MMKSNLELIESNSVNKKLKKKNAKFEKHGFLKLKYEKVVHKQFINVHELFASITRSGKHMSLITKFINSQLNKRTLFTNCSEQIYKQQTLPLMCSFVIANLFPTINDTSTPAS